MTADAGGTWSYTPSLPDGPHAFMAHATDLAGNVRDSSPLYMTLDTTAPTIRLFDDTGASASDHITANPILTGTAAPGTAVTLMEGTTVLGTGTTDGTGTWAFLPTIEEGSHTVTVNTAGGSSSLTFTLDNSLVPRPLVWPTTPVRAPATTSPAMPRSPARQTPELRSRSMI